MEPPEDRSMSLEIIEVRGDDRTRVEPILDWLPRRGWWLGPTVVGFALLLGFVLGFVVRGLVIIPVAPASGPPGPTAAVEAPGEPRPEVLVQTAPLPPTPPKVARTSPPAERPRPAAPEEDGAMIELELTSEPADAWVIQDGVVYGKTPLTVPVAVGRACEFLIKKDGHQPQRLRWKPGAPTTLSAALVSEVKP